MTLKIYETESYQREIDTVIESCVPEENGVFVTLRETIFFPEEGGQYADTGVLQFADEEVRLLDGQICGGEIRYQVEQPIPAGTAVHGVLDWDMRYMRMQQHTGEHILTGLLHNKYGFDNVGFHLSDTAPVTLDLNGNLSPEQVAEMEVTANEAIYANLPVVDSYPSKVELSSMSYRSKIDIEGQVRLITVLSADSDKPLDVCACCAPHVKSTAEVGIIKVISVQKYKGGTRISILCGKRALLHYQSQWNTLNRIAAMYSTAPETAENTIAKQKAELEELKLKVSELEEQEILREISEMSVGTNGCIFSDKNLSAHSMKSAFNTLADRCEGYAGLFVGCDETGYRFYAGSRTLDTKELAAAMRRSLGAKGGGAGEMIQGKVDATRADIETFFGQL